MRRKPNAYVARRHQRHAETIDRLLAQDRQRVQGRVEREELAGAIATGIDARRRRPFDGR
jgi:hypothetical protein